jgi:hypothetical protein
MNIKKLLISALGLFILCAVYAQPKSPDDFLGYKIGSRYTAHWKVVSYFQHLASNASAMMKLQAYGETYEDRPLMIAIFSSPENMQRIENIRMNNLRLAYHIKDNITPVEEHAPAIVWLSYNVHGNETSSSEAAMLTAFTLVNPSETRTKEWLKNTVVIIDPCLNPDGRDRYVNWFTSVAGKDFDPRLDAREHREPWPGGRSNHYNFDLNRDWAWQTQVESQQRIKIYNEWLPHIHVDYHEQYINSPYYFAPAAQPFHEVITQWQSDFQVTIGRNHAKYFDEKGWLYFTKEIFDLFYPSYGDTYPTFNGAIGMTYEQAGHSLAGLGVITGAGDTLTLYDRLIHHHTTGLSTIEISSQHAGRLVKEFRKYFNDAVSTGIGEYKTYIIKYQPDDAQRISSLLELLDKNGIQYGTAAGSGRGFSYQTGKDEPFAISTGDVVISAVQPKSALVKVLLEPRSRLVDSVTYDITAWALPYVYAVHAFAVKAKINVIGPYDKPVHTAPAKSGYGYIIKWQGIQSAKAVAQLLKQGVQLRFAEQPFETAGEKFGRGSVIILRTGNERFGAALWEKVFEACQRQQIKPFAVYSGFSDKGPDFGSSKFRLMKAPKVVLLTGEGISPNAAGEIWHFFDRELNYPVTLINAADAGRADWNNIDVLILPNGNYRFLSDKTSAEEFKNWVNRGGKVVALEDAVSQLANLDWINVKVKKADTADKSTVHEYEALKKYEDRERDRIPGVTPGSIFKVELDNTHPLAFGYPDYYYTLKQDEAIYEFMKDGWNVGVIKKDNQVAGFVGAKLKNFLKDGLLFGVQHAGRGTITFFADNIIFRNFWENGKLLLCNAVFVVGQ